MSDFDCAFELLIGHEGGFSDDPHDRGNWTGGEPGKGVLKGTKYGISAKAYPLLDIRNLTLDDARAIYRRDYWNPIEGDALPWGVALATFDAAVNSGVGTAARWLQSAVNVAADGAIGPVTLAAVARWDSRELAAELIARRAHAMPAMPTWGKHGLGWMRRVITLAMQASAR